MASHDLPAGHLLTSTDLRTGSWPTGAVPQGMLKRATGEVLAGPIRAGEPLTEARVIGPGLLAGQPTGTVAVPIRLGDPSVSGLVRPGDRVDVLTAAASGSVGSGNSSAWSSEPDLADGTTLPNGDGTAPSGPSNTSASGNASTSRDGYGAGSQRVASAALVLAVPGSAGADAAGAGSGSGVAGLGGLGSGGGSDPSGTATTGMIVLAVSSTQAARLATAQAGGALTVVILPTS